MTPKFRFRLADLQVKLVERKRLYDQEPRARLLRGATSVVEATFAAVPPSPRLSGSLGVRSSGAGCCHDRRIQTHARGCGTGSRETDPPVPIASRTPHLALRLKRGVHLNETVRRASIRADNESKCSPQANSGTNQSLRQCSPFFDPKASRRLGRQVSKPRSS
jgi:hypothetical protein